MTIKTLLGAAAFATTTAFTATAAPINLDFSFGGVTGTFYGLDDALTGSQAASSFDLVGQLDTYTGIDTSGARLNEFVFNSGAISTAVFLLSGPTRSDAAGVILIDFEFLDIVAPDIIGLATEITFPLNGVFGPRKDYQGLVTFSPPPVASVPLPAGAVLLLSGLAGVARLKRRKKHAA